MKLSLFNSLTRKREVFTPINPDLIGMYVCGPTVYDHPHIGNARSVVVYDVLYRVLTHLYSKEKVRYVRNLTDIDDKIIARAIEENTSIDELTKRTTEYFHKDMNYLGCLEPNFEPKATEHIAEMVDIINKLLSSQIAYQANNHVYFDVSKAKNYTKLSGRSFEDMLEGVRVENSTDKKHPNDFVLWKPAHQNDDESAKFQSPFGEGRPGWHIECSAMSHRYLGETFDIHGGGADLIFPHHTNEIAQSCSAFPGSEFAKTWVHNGFLTVNHEKMSKSLGNFITVDDLIQKGVRGEIIRLFLLSNHYRKPLDYNDKAISDAAKMLDYWYRAIEDINPPLVQTPPSVFIETLLDDINTNNAIKIINDFAKQAHAATNEDQKLEAVGNLLASARFLALLNTSPAKWFKCEKNEERINILIAKRAQAKQLKDWALADSMRAELLSIGVVVEDKPDGSSSWRKV
ncbi:MAG: cysteine--tRNA ligase [Rickettsiales bacterium]|nr:MAG: cysteine--tRNA ligase [Rickettsiales bacterium]